MMSNTTPGDFEPMESVVSTKRGLIPATKRQLSYALSARNKIFSDLSSEVGTEFARLIVSYASIEKRRVGTWLGWGRSGDLQSVCMAAMTYRWLVDDPVTNPPDLEFVDRIMSVIRKLGQTDQE